MTDTEYGTDHNRVAGSDVSFKKGEHFQANGSFLSSHSRSVTGETSADSASQGSYFYNTRRFAVAGQLEHYDRGFRMDTAFFNRVGLTRGWQYQDLNFYPSHPRFDGSNGSIRFSGCQAAKDRVQGGTEAFYLPAFDSTSRAPGSCASTTATATKRSPDGSSTSAE